MHHGHVRPNEDGSKTDCGGVEKCATCQAEQQAYSQEANYQQSRHTYADSTASRMDYLIGRIEALVTELGPQHIVRGMRTVDVYEGIVACLEKVALEKKNGL